MKLYRWIKTLKIDDNRSNEEIKNELNIESRSNKSSRERD